MLVYHSARLVFTDTETKSLGKNVLAVPRHMPKSRLTPSAPKNRGGRFWGVGGVRRDLGVWRGEGVFAMGFRPNYP